MSDKPKKRRWFQFRLSTYLVLVGLLAWAMAIGPTIDFGHQTIRLTRELAKRRGVAFFIVPDDSNDPFENLQDIDNFHCQLNLTMGARTHWFWTNISPKKILWPALALAAFLGWKLVWLFVERRRARAT